LQLTVFVVVAHSAFELTVVLGRLLRLLDGFLNLVVVLVVGDGKAGVVGRLGLVRVLFVERGGRGGVVVVAVGDVDGGLGHANFLLVLGLVAGTVLTLDLVDGGVLGLLLVVVLLVVVVKVREVVVVVVVRFLFGVVVVKGDAREVMGTTVNLDDGMGVRRRRSVLLVTWGTGFLAVRLSLLRGRRGGSVVLVLAAGFPRGELDLKLRVGLSLSCGLGRLGLSSLFLFVRRGEDAEGDGEAGFKIQVGDLSCAGVFSSTTFRYVRRKEDQEDFSCSSF
jgi:hypothetical protein